MSRPAPFISTSPSGWIDAGSCGASGSDYQCRATVRKGSNALDTDDPGDFRRGQQVTVSDCNPHYYGTVYNEREPYAGRNLQPVEDELELRGLDPGKAWQTFVIHFTDYRPVRFSWMTVAPEYQTKTTTHPVLKRHWAWNGSGIELPRGWFALTDGVEARFRKRNWRPGQCISLHARNRFIATIVGVRGKRLLLDRQAPHGSETAVVRHFDQAALQSAVDRAVAERKGLYLPAGRYRLDAGLWIRNASLRVEGAHQDHTLLDVTEAHTAAFWIAGGRTVAIRNLGMVGHTGFLEMPANTEFFTATGHPFYPMANQQMEVKGCAAANVVGTEHLLFEDVTVSRMASEAFYLHGGDRYGAPPFVQFPHDGMPELGAQYTKSCVFHRCRVFDCGFNAFNNNDYAENTQILHCHVERTANFCENPSRFTRIIGNYVKDGCATSVHLGAPPGQAGQFRKLAGAHAIIADNVFEGGRYSGGIAIGKTASNVTVAHNMFVGFSKETAITVWGGDRVVISGNHIDLTQVEDNPDNQRCGISVETSGVIVAGNHIYANDALARKAVGINIADHATGIHVHDNTIENCLCGLVSGSRVYVPRGSGGAFEFRHTESEVVNVLGPSVFACRPLPPMRALASGAAGWKLRWLSGSRKGRETTVASLSADGQTITVSRALSVKKGDAFIIYPGSCRWQVHHNIIRGCATPLRVHPPGSRRGLRLKDNEVERGGTALRA